MAYQAKRGKLYQEEFQLVDENGAVVETLHVELDPDSMAKKLSEKYVALQRALADTQNVSNGRDPDEMLQVLGDAVTDVLEAVFGTSDAQKIVEFFRGHYMEMCKEILPFVTQTVIPEVRKMAQENRAAIASGYNRKQRRLFKRM